MTRARRPTASSTSASSFTPTPEALVLGYGNLSDALVDEAVGRLARVIRSLG